jgi:putative Ca2+/H+ antiporter (TMEM165/GDT1 family)
MQAFWLVFISEFGDRTQIMVIIFTARFTLCRLWALSSITMVAMNTLSTCLGFVLKLIIPPYYVSLIVVILFLGLGSYTLVVTCIELWGCCKKKEKEDGESSSDDDEADILRELEEFDN